MSISAQRLDLLIDVFEHEAQRALPLQGLTVRQMIDSILQEFAEIEHLGRVSSAYQLVRAEGGEPLEMEAPLHAQLRAGDHVRLVEREIPTPSATWRPIHSLYLRERDERGTVHRVGWLPAFIGRPLLDESDEHLAVNLQEAPTGMRVSRRHLRLSEEGGRYFVEALSENPATLQRAGEAPTALLPEHPTELRAGDTILLDRSNIHLRFLVRERPETLS